MCKYNFGPRDFDNPSFLFLLEDVFNNLFGGKFIYSPYFKSFVLNGSENILDFGCGGGVSSQVLANQLDETGSLTCVDLSDYWVKKAKKRLMRYPKVTIRQGDIREMDIPDSSFDVITIHYVLHDILSEIRQAIASRLSDLLKPDGRLFIKEPTKLSHGIPVEEIRVLFHNSGLKEFGFSEKKSYYSGIYIKA
ncbi:MAG: class I SAM-dependent methyltransferase [Dehalococcoidales bacterium]|nr:class I SAM-dependent methyltransferase [Dehalococcoidales bacterium]